MNKKNDETKELLKKVAIEQIEAQGVQNTSLRSIAKAAGLTTGAFYYYYDSKQALFDDIIEDAIHFSHRLFEKSHTENLTGDILLEDIVTNLRSRMHNTPAQKLNIALLSDAIYDENSKKEYQEKFLAINERTGSMFAPAFGIKDSKKAAQVASILTAALDGFAVQKLLGALPTEDDEFIETFLDFFQQSIPAYLEKSED